MVPVVSIACMVVLPFYVLWRSKHDRPLQRPYLFSIGSFAFCATAMLEEIFTLRRRLFAGDIGGMEDTIGAVLLICIIVLIVAVILNFAALALSYETD